MCLFKQIKVGHYLIVRLLHIVDIRPVRRKRRVLQG